MQPPASMGAERPQVSDQATSPFLRPHPKDPIPSGANKQNTSDLPVEEPTDAERRKRLLALITLEKNKAQRTTLMSKFAAGKLDYLEEHFKGSPRNPYDVIDHTGTQFASVAMRRAVMHVAVRKTLVKIAYNGDGPNGP